MEIREKLKSGRVILGTMLSELYTPNAARIFSACGLDYFLVDCEHGAFDWSAVAAMAACSKAAGFPMIVRIPKIDREGVLKYLEMGAEGILAPMVQDAQQAAELVEYAKYAPLGSRGISTRRSHNDYMPTDMTVYLERANRKTMLFVQIETCHAVGNLEEIARVNGIDGLVIGPNDLSSDMGDCGNVHTPEMREAIQETIERAKESGICSGIIASDLALLQQYAKKGMQFISWGSELSVICVALQKTVRFFETNQEMGEGFC